MIRSMTGFGTASAEEGGAHYAVEVRSLNNKYFKCIVRAPEELQGIEAELEAAVAKRLTRGSVVVTVRFFDSSANAAATINTAAMQRYVEQLITVDGLSHDSTHLDMGALLALPGVVVADAGESLIERARPILLRLADEACDKVLVMRDNEGRQIHTELHKHREAIAERLSVIADRAPVVVDLYQQRLRQRMKALLDDVSVSVDDEEFLREVAVFAERTDIAEEVARLQGHLSQFAEIIDTNDDEPSGRTLDFLSQEMLREANTIASKCLDVDISRLTVEIKGAIDRIKEQAQNIE